MFLAMVMIVGQAAVASAATFTYDGAWQTNDIDFFFYVTFSAPNPDAELYIYDFDEGASDDLLIYDNGYSPFATVYLTLDSGIWYAGLSAGAKTLDLGVSKNIGFYFSDGTNDYPSYLVTTTSFPGEVYQLSDSNTGMTVIVSDIAPASVPLPTTLFLMGSGIIPLVVYRRKSR